MDSGLFGPQMSRSAPHIGRFSAISAHPMFFEPIEERLVAQTHEACSGRAVPLRPFEGLAEEVGLHLIPHQALGRETERATLVHRSELRTSTGRSSSLTRPSSASRTSRSTALDELAHVPRPAVLHQARSTAGDNDGHLDAVARRRLFEKGRREQRHVLEPVAQRRQLDRHHVESVIEVLAKTALRHQRRQVAVGGRDHPHIALDLPDPPTRVKRRSCSTRKSVAWRGSGIDAISSSRSVPPSASSKRPSRRRWAPVNDPFSWPKSSLSIRVSGMAAQLTATKGPFARRLARCSVRATSSLPVPDSPTTNTVASVAATFSMVR